jgi:rhodanese-related sulfurtransferase
MNVRVKPVGGPPCSMTAVPGRGRRTPSIARSSRWLCALLLCGSLLPLGCRREATQSSAPAPTSSANVAATPVPPAAFDVKPVLREFLKALPADWYLVSAREVASTKPFIVDVRQPEEYAKGSIEGATNIPIRGLAVNLRALPGKDKPIALVCDNGHRSAIGMAVLQMLGYRNVRTLDRGLRAWNEANLPLVTVPAPARMEQSTPDIDPALQASLDYYLVHTLPATWGTMGGADLNWDQNQKSSAELEPSWDNFEQGHSYLTDVDDAAEFASAQRASTKVAEAINLPLREIPDVLDRVPMREFVNRA